MTSAVKELPSPSPCTKCGKPTWSMSGLCFGCRGAAKASGLPLMSPPNEVRPPPVTWRPQREIAKDERGRLAEDIFCRRCAYNLRGLVVETACPECGLPIARSILGDLLQFSDPAWVRRLALGVRLIIIGALAGIGFSIVSSGVGVILMGGPNWTAMMALSALGVGLSSIFLIGVWFLTMRDPGHGGQERILSARRITRWTSIVQLASGPMQLSLMSTMGTTAAPVAGNPFTAPTPAMMFLMIASMTVATIALISQISGLWLLQRLAQRLPRESLARNTRVVAIGFGISATISHLSGWFMQMLMPALMGPTPSTMGAAVIPVACGGCFGAVGALVFGIWAIVLLFMYGAAFRRTAAIAERVWLQTEAT